MASTRPPRVFTIPASAPFLPTLIEALMEDRLGSASSPAAIRWRWPSATIYLPTRRACRLAQQIFLDVLKSDAAILPRIVPIGDVDEDELAFAEAAIGETAGATLDLPEPLGGLERKVLLAQLILKWAASPEMRGDGNFSLVANSPAAALALAGDLARLMDDMVTRQVPWDRLDDLVPDDMDEYWQKTLRFLKIAREYWPARAEGKRPHRAGRAPRQADRGGGEAPCDRHRPGDRGGLHRLDPGDRDACSPPSRSCRTARWCCPASTPISTTRPGT